MTRERTYSGGKNNEQVKENQKWDNRLKITAVSGIGAITATALIGVIASYFGG